MATPCLNDLDLRGPFVPSELILIGAHAFPVVMNSQGEVLMAASLYGEGRIVVLGHETYLTSFPALVENALTWLRGSESYNLSVGVHQNVKGVADNASKRSFQVKVVGSFSSNLEAGVYVTDAYSVGADPKDLVAFMKAGGGVLIAGQAWSWYQRHPGVNTLLHFDGNKVSGVAGIYFSERYGGAERVPISPQLMGNNFEDDLKFLLKGVSEFDLTGGSILSEILVHSPVAFPIATTDDGRAFLAGTYYGRGRVIVISHEGFLSRQTLTTFWTNALRWLDQGRQGVVGVVQHGPLSVLSKSGLKCEKTGFRDDLSVFVCTAYSDDYSKEIQDFVAEGGGLLVGGHAWYWAYTHSLENPMTDFSGNKVLNKLGLSLMGNMLGGGVYKAPESSQAIKNNYLFRHLLHRFAGHIINGDKLSEHEMECFQKLGNDLTNYLQMTANDWPSYTQVLSALTDILLKASMPQVSRQKQTNNTTAQSLRPVTWPRWISTGLYLSPGMKTNMTLPAQIVNTGWKIQISCQTDRLNHSELKRAAKVYQRFPVTSVNMQVWNLWGGLIYLLAPPKTQVQGVEVTVQQAVLAPYYKSGESYKIFSMSAEWSVLRTAPSPWAELELDNIIFSVPSDFVRDLERPDEVAASWNDLMNAIADLAVIPHKFSRKERFVTDVQISHGWMHAGYPIMAHKVSASTLVNIKQAKIDGLWGPIHELGHNQQRSYWEFPSHTTECTCNLWSVYVHEEVLGINRAKAHSALTPENRRSRTEDYVNKGRNLSNWHVWVALETYLQLQEKFGWDAFKRVFAGYHEMSNYPNNNEEKMNLYAETFSRAVGMDLTGFFKAWGWPIEAATVENVSYLPAWTDHPMAQYN
uniref:Peptidase M60 domain-containing protein n=1 Tax=Mola mola TaxID=94237 RepID=A0A3Q3XAR4_MOLML